MKNIKYVTVFIFVLGLTLSIAGFSPAKALVEPAPQAVPEDGEYRKYMTISGACCFLCGLRPWCTMVYYHDLCTVHCQKPYNP